MATFAVGDVHGSIEALDDLMRQLRTVATKGDVIVYLGDYIDRGADSKACIDAILGFQQESDAQVVCLLGNHEDWLLDTHRDYCRHSWLLGMDGLTTVRSYSAEAERILRDAASQAGSALYQKNCALPYEAFFEHVPDAHMQFFESLALYHRGSDGLCTHGGLNPHVARFEDQTRTALIWGAQGFPDEYNGDETIAYGHWNNAALNPAGWPAPAVVGNTIGLDTIAHGVLTAVRLSDRRVFQSARYEVADV